MQINVLLHHDAATVDRLAGGGDQPSARCCGRVRQGHGRSRALFVEAVRVLKREGAAVAGRGGKAGKLSGE